MPRYDRYTETSVQEIYFRDFDASFQKNPITGNLATIQNDVDAKRMLRNLILTNRGERHYQPTLGSRVAGMLFENADSVTIELVRTTIQQAVRRYLPFIEIIDLRVDDIGSRDRKGNPGFDANSLVVVIVFGLTNSAQTYELSIPLRRVR
jgi:phage baseplate assembly protein W